MRYEGFTHAIPVFIELLRREAATAACGIGGESR